MISEHPNMLMNPRIEIALEKLSRQLEEIIERANRLNHDQLNFKPSVTSWSILQVFQHLITAEKHTNLYLRKNILEGKKLQSAGNGSKIKASILTSFMFIPFKFKAPAEVDVKMDKEYRYEDRVREWRNQRNQLISFLKETDVSMSDKLLFKHGSGIRMNLEQMLSWTFVHADRHTRQIERIINDSKFPNFQQNNSPYQLR